MKIIKELVENINEEVEGAEHYAKLATKYKDEDKVLADNYAKMAEAELTHVDSLHTQVVRIIKDWKGKGEQVPPAMQVLYDWEHERQIEKVRDIKILMSLYRS